jgi:hypothetical protein
MFLAESSVIRVCEIVVPLHLQSSGAHGDPLHKAERVRRDARASPRCIRANALYEGRYLLGTAMARPCIAKRQVEIAHLENATYVSHGSTGKGNDQVRFEVCYLGMDPTLQCITLWRQREYLEKFEGRQARGPSPAVAA